MAAVLSSRTLKGALTRIAGPMHAQTVTTAGVIGGQQQCRGINHWADWRMLKDYKKRMTVVAEGAERIRVNTIRKNDILPREIREIADVEVAALPRNSSYMRLVYRCAVTSRPKGCVKPWRVSRIIFRHLADYNKLSGVQRAMWG